MELAQRYDFKEAEPRMQKSWEDKKIFTYKEQKGKKIYSIDTPPPYVSAFHLHVGHGMSYAQAEFIARYKRMRGFNVFYPMGFDDNGLPTERYVETKYKVDKSRITREEFVKLCLKETKEGGDHYRQLWTRLGISVDWDELYSTIDPRAQRVSQRSFIDLYKKGKIEHLDSPTTWCMHCQTAIAQAEFENVDIKSHFNDIIFKAPGKDLIIATTRPELIPACVALFAHPEDTRYKDMKGKKARVPLFDYEVPILFDEAVDKEKGTGLMMCCTFGDKDDVDKWHRHKLPLRVVFTSDGRMNELSGKFKGLKIKEAREKIREELKEAKLLVSETEIVHPVNVHERCGTEIEFLKTKQWFIKIIDEKEEFLKMGDKINWYPEHMKVRYKHWVEGLQWNWCISRQRFYGVPFPIWYSKKTGEVVLPELSQLPVDPLKDKPLKLPAGHTAEDIIPEADVMDTWATSSVTPLINARWGDKDEMKQIIPMSLRPQAHDIIRTWAFYTIVKSYYHFKEVPWTDIMMSGHGQDQKGKKMSKSKGNFIAIEEMLDKYGADAFRFWAASSKLGEDFPFQEKDLVTGGKTVTKLWNASRFVLMNLQDYTPAKAKLTVVDKWLISKLQRIIQTSTENFDKYDYSRCKAETENFFWNTFCDEYLELVKDRFYNEANYPEGNSGAKYTLYTALLSILKLFAPIMPHVTEEIYQHHFSEHEKIESIHVSSWPEYDSKLMDEKSEKIVDALLPIISYVRTYKNKNQMSLKTELSEIVIECPKDIEEGFKQMEKDILGVTKAKKMTFGKASEELGNGINIEIQK